MQNIKWMLFDVSGVVTQFTLNKPEGYTVGSRFFNQKELEGIYFEKEYQNYMLGTLSHEQFVSRYLKKHKLDLSVEEFTVLFKNDIAPTKGMEEIFMKLEKKYKIALVTNEGKVLAKYRIEESGLIPYLSKVIPSYLIRELKPSVHFFKKTLKIINAKPDECIFVDDTKVNCDGAELIGIKSILFKNVRQLEDELVKLGIL